ncbi:MAG: peptidoglycan editing factor PgeF [Oscillospiraceae bacterium]
MNYIRFFEKYNGVTAYFTTRLGGISQEHNNSLNLGFNTGDLLENVLENRKIVKSDMGLLDCIEIIPQQVHKSDIAVVTDEMINTNKSYIRLGDFDGLVTNKTKVLLTTGHADCLAVYLYDYKNNVIGLSHAGWRGTQLNIVKHTAEKMINELGADVNTMIGAVSPGISKCCFEVGEEVYEKFKNDFSFIDDYAVKKDNGKFNLDLKGINKRQFLDIGIENVEVSDYCTSCSTELFFSYRKENGKTGRMCAGLAMK